MLPSPSVIRYQNNLINNKAFKKCDTKDIYKIKTLKRIGIIPYYIINNVIYYFLCVDANYGTFTDPGGTIERGEDFLISATRELYEESMGTFDYRSSDNIEFIKNSSTLIHNNIMGIIFQYIKLDSPDDICYIFRERYEQALLNKNTEKHLIENSYLLWISQDDLKLLCSDNFHGKIPLPESLKELLLPNPLLPKNLIIPKCAITQDVIKCI
jgi:hypothetical protein